MNLLKLIEKNHDFHAFVAIIVLEKCIYIIHTWTERRSKNVNINKKSR